VSKTDSIKPTYDSLNTVFKDIRAFVQLVDLLPEDDDGSAIFRILSDRLEADFLSLRNEVYALWKFVPDNGSES
jgi:hypothetical protein